MTKSPILDRKTGREKQFVPRQQTSEPSRSLNTLMLSVWLPVIVWTVIIIVESAAGSAANTGSLLQKVTNWLFGYVAPEGLALLHHVLRKVGHFLGYGILGCLWLRAIRQSYASAPPFAGAVAAITATVVTASLDEWHQSFSSARAGQFADVVLDTAGALVLVSLALFLFERRRAAR